MKTKSVILAGLLVLPLLVGCGGTQDYAIAGKQAMVVPDGFAKNSTYCVSVNTNSSPDSAFTGMPRPNFVYDDTTMLKCGLSLPEATDLATRINTDLGLTK